jgi:alkanesulfonate monooxygenase SsuD/methylene tetrahydromethanopterin reductase-like flavin-dependent oxidoreductase (luciferase family)
MDAAMGRIALDSNARECQYPIVYTLRFDMRAPSADPPLVAGLYRTAIEMAAWGEQHDCLSALISEHHTSPDGYLPSPLVLASAIAARTSSLPIIFGALLLNFYDPIKLAEDIAVLDIVSGGRVAYIIGLGYRPEEYAMFGVDMAERGNVMEAKLTALRRALAGEVFDFEGRRVHVTPSPISPGGPALMYGGHSIAAARRAGRFGLDFFAEGDSPGLEDAYRTAAAEAGTEPGNCIVPTGSNPTTLFIAEDLDTAWDRIGPHMLHDAQMYRSWMGADHDAASKSAATTVEELRAEEGPYRIVTPAAAVEMIQAGQPLVLQPLCGGLNAEVAWESLHLLGERVLPALL